MSSSESKPKPSPRPKLKHQKIPEQTFSEPEVPQENDRLLKGEKRNFIKLNLTQEEFDAANEENTTKSDKKDNVDLEENILCESKSDTFQKDSSDFGNIETVRLYDVKDKRRGFSGSKVHGTNLKGPHFDVEVADNRIVKDTVKPGNLSLKVEHIVLKKHIEPKPMQEVSVVNLHQAEAETMSQMDNSTSQDTLPKNFNLNQLGLVKPTDRHPILNDQKSPMSSTAEKNVHASQLPTPFDHDSTLSHEPTAKLTAAGVEDATKTTKLGQESTKDSNSTFNDAAIIITKEHEVDVVKVSEMNQPELEIKALGDCHSTLDKQKHEIPPSRTSKDDTTLNDIIHSILSTVTVLEVQVFDDMERDQSKSQQDAAKDRKSYIRENVETTEIISKTLHNDNNKQKIGKCQINEHRLIPCLKEDGSSTEMVKTASNPGVAVLECSAIDHLPLEAPNTLVAESLSLAAITTPQEKICKIEDLMRTPLESESSSALTMPVLLITSPSLVVEMPLIGLEMPSSEEETSSLGEKRTCLGPETTSLGPRMRSLGAGTMSLGEEMSSLEVGMMSLEVETASNGVETTSLQAGTSSLGAKMTSLEVEKTSFGAGMTISEGGTTSLGVGMTLLGDEAKPIAAETTSLEAETTYLGVKATSLGVETPSSVVNTLISENASKHVDSNEKAFETNIENRAPIDQKTVSSDVKNPVPASANATISDQAPTPESTNTSLQTTASLDQDTLLSEPTTPSLFTPPPRVGRLRGYLMKRGGALKAWKQRWFVFTEERNALVYFRTPRDLTPLGQVCLNHASFTCEGAEPGVFYLHTPEKIVTLKAQSEELKFYWLQQLQLRRWIHRPNNTATTDTADTSGAELFPQLECVGEVNTEETTSQPFLLQLSLKHPLIELQNSVQILRRRSSNDSSSQSVFHIPTSSLTSPTNALTNPIQESTSANRKPQRESRSTFRKSSPALMQATPSSSQTLSTSTLTSHPSGEVSMRRRSRTFLRRSITSWSERSRLQQELQDQKDLVLVLQKALELCQAEKRSSRNNKPDLILDQSSTDQEDLNQSTQSPEDLRCSTESPEGLRRLLDQTQTELEELKTNVEQKDQIILQLKKDNRELSEKNLVKQQVIQKLSSSVSRWAEESSDVDQNSVQNLVQQNQDLQDDLKAFRKQNHFLNSEIHHLSGLWRTSTESQRVLMSKVSVQRAQYLRILREIQEISQRDGAQREALKNIIQNALSLEQSQLQAQVHRDRDQYGFQLVQDFEVEDLKLLIKIQAPDLKSTQGQEAVERPLLAQWDQFMSSCRGELSPSPDLKSLIRTGIPPHLRAQVWNWIIRTRTQRDQDPLQYQQLCEQMESSPQSGSRPWSRQIDLDLPRTLCTNQNFSSPSSPALQQLRRILLAFSWENPSIGYCQGLNRIAGLLLLVLGSEEDTFWALKAVVENIMPPEYYSPSLVGSQADQCVLKDFLAEKLPRLSSHLERCGVDISSSTFTWFLVVFVEVLPSHILMPLWDAFLYEGSKVLFRFSLALFKLKESEILQLSSPLELHQYFRVLPKTVLDYRRLSVVAFDELNPFSRRAIRSRRALHLERLQRELSDLRKQQSLFLSQRSVRKSTDDEGAGVEPEEALDNNSEED